MTGRLGEFSGLVVCVQEPGIVSFYYYYYYYYDYYYILCIWAYGVFFCIFIFQTLFYELCAT